MECKLEYQQKHELNMRFSLLSYILTTLAAMKVYVLPKMKSESQVLSRRVRQNSNSHRKCKQENLLDINRPKSQK